MKTIEGSAIYLREFDTKKYQNIEPLARKVENKMATDEEVDSLFSSVVKILESEDFRKNNHESDGTSDRIDLFLKSLLENREIISSLDIKAIDRSSHDFTLNLVLLLSCPRYQIPLQLPPESQTTVNVTEFYWEIQKWNAELFDLLENPDVETFSYEEQGNISIYSQAAVKKIEKLASMEADKLPDERSRHIHVVYYRWQRQLRDLARSVLANNNTIVRDIL